MQTDFENVEAEEAEPTARARDMDGVPYCRDHHCRMKQSSGGKKHSPTSYYKCPVPRCDAKAQMIKTRREQVVPPTPLVCPHCSSESKPVYCVRSKKHSTAAFVILVCPACEWKSNSLALPQLAAQHYDSRRSSVVAPMIGDR